MFRFILARVSGLQAPLFRRFTCNDISGSGQLFLQFFFLFFSISFFLSIVYFSHRRGVRIKNLFSKNCSEHPITSGLTPFQKIWGPLVAILDFTVGAALRAVSALRSSSLLRSSSSLMSFLFLRSSSFFSSFCHTRVQLGTQVDLSSCKSSTCKLGHEVV